MAGGGEPGPHTRRRTTAERHRWIRRRGAAAVSGAISPPPTITRPSVAHGGGRRFYRSTGLLGWRRERSGQQRRPVVRLLASISPRTNQNRVARIGEEREQSETERRMRVGWVGGWGARWCGVGGVAGARHLTTGRVNGARDGAVVRARARLHGGARGSVYRSQAMCGGGRARSCGRRAAWSGPGWAEVGESTVAAVGDTGCALRPPQTLSMLWHLQLTASSLSSSDQLPGCPLRVCRLRGWGRCGGGVWWRAARGVGQCGVAFRLPSASVHCACVV